MIHSVGHVLPGCFLSFFFQVLDLISQHIQKDNVRQALVKNILLVEFIIIISFKIIEWYVRSVTIIYLQCNKHNDEWKPVTYTYYYLGMFGIRKFRYRYTGKNIPVIPVYRYFGLVKSWVLLNLQNHEMDEKSKNIEL